MAKSKPTNGLRTTPRRSAATASQSATRSPTLASSSRSSKTDASGSKPAVRRKSRTAASAKASPHLRKVRVWWPPTRDKRKTDYGGAYWPAKVTGRTDKGFRVEYDNGDIEVTHPENISPLEVPMEFGQEATRLRAREYCEVFNGSRTDPAAWLARIHKVGRGAYTIAFPFHDSNDEVVKEARVRRARVYVEDEQAWKFIDPTQEWEDGEVTSPLELQLLMSISDVDEVLQQAEQITEDPELEPSTTRNNSVTMPKRAGDEPTKNKKDKKRRMEEDDDLQPDLVPLPIVSNAYSLNNPPGCETTSDMKLASNLCLMQQLAGLPNIAQASQPADVKPPARRKRKKDTDTPKKPKTSYVAFMEEHRAKMKESDPNMATQDVMKKIGELWSRATIEEKEACEKIAQDDRERYRKEMAAYVPPSQLQSLVACTDQHKNPASAYSLFTMDYRNTLESVPYSNAIIPTGQAWRIVEKKSDYEANADVIKDSYDKARKEYITKVAKQKEQQQYLIRSLLAGPHSSPLVDPGWLAQRRDSQEKIPEVSVHVVLSMLDMNKARTEILKVFDLEAFYYLCDVWREGSERIGDALRAFNCHILGREKRPDWRGFFVSVFGVEKMKSFLKTDQDGLAGTITESYKSTIDSTVNENDADTGPSNKPIQLLEGKVVNSECEGANDQGTPVNLLDQ